MSTPTEAEIRSSILVALADTPLSELLRNQGYLTLTEILDYSLGVYNHSNEEYTVARSITKHKGNYWIPPLTHELRAVKSDTLDDYKRRFIWRNYTPDQWPVKIKHYELYRIDNRQQLYRDEEYKRPTEDDAGIAEFLKTWPHDTISAEQICDSHFCMPYSVTTAKFIAKHIKWKPFRAYRADGSRYNAYRKPIPLVIERNPYLRSYIAGLNSIVADDIIKNVYNKPTNKFYDLTELTKVMRELGWYKKTLDDKVYYVHG